MIKERTKIYFAKWAETHKMSEEFTWEGKKIKGSEFKKLLHGDAPKAEAKPAPIIEEQVNIDIDIDIEEEEHADMGTSFDGRDSEEY